MWLLRLNLMRDRCETLDVVARADTREQLVEFLRQETEPWHDSGEKRQVHDTDIVAQNAGSIVIGSPRAYVWKKTFRQGSILEWYNPPYNDEEAFVDIGNRDDFISKQTRDAERRWDDMLSDVPPVTREAKP